MGSVHPVRTLAHRRELHCINQRTNLLGGLDHLDEHTISAGFQKGLQDIVGVADGSGQAAGAFRLGRGDDRTRIRK